MYPTILVMLAFDDRDEGVLAAAEALATRVGLQRLLLVHVYRQDPFPAWMDESRTTSPERPAELDAAIRSMTPRLPGVEIAGIHAVGSPPEQLQDIVSREDVDLLIIGRNDVDGDTPGWGPSGQDLLRSVTCSAMVVPRSARLDLRHAVVGLDFSHGAADALGVATRIADEAEAVYQYDLGAVAVGTQTREEFAAHLEQRALEHWTEDVLPRLGDVQPPRLRVVQGNKASSLLIKHAGEHLLVVGSRGMTRLATLFLGSTAERVAGRCRGPVLIVRRKGEQMGLLEGLAHR